MKIAWRAFSKQFFYARAKNHFTAFDYMDELVSEYDLDEEEQEILQTLFKEVYHCFNAD